MKIAVPTSGGRLCPHFGHCEEFHVFEVQGDGRTVAGRESQVPPPHEPGLLPRWLHGMGVTHIIAGGMGGRAQQLFAESGIEVVTGAPCDETQSVVANYLSGTLETGDNCCDH